MTFPQNFPRAGAFMPSPESGFFCDPKDMTELPPQLFSRPELQGVKGSVEHFVLSANVLRSNFEESGSDWGTYSPNYSAVHMNRAVGWAGIREVFCRPDRTRSLMATFIVDLLATPGFLDSVLFLFRAPPIPDESSERAARFGFMRSTGLEALQFLVESNTFLQRRLPMCPEFRQCLVQQIEDQPSVPPSASHRKGPRLDAALLFFLTESLFMFFWPKKPLFRGEEGGKKCVPFCLNAWAALLFVESDHGSRTATPGAKTVIFIRLVETLRRLMDGDAVFGFFKHLFSAESDGAANGMDREACSLFLNIVHGSVASREVQTFASQVASGAAGEAEQFFHDMRLKFMIYERHLALLMQCKRVRQLVRTKSHKKALKQALEKVCALFPEKHCPSLRQTLASGLLSLISLLNSPVVDEGALVSWGLSMVQKYLEDGQGEVLPDGTGNMYKESKRQHKNAVAMPCDGCGKATPEGSLQVCSSCLCVRYCSAACQKASWKGGQGHKHRCKLLREGCGAMALLEGSRDLGDFGGETPETAENSEGEGGEETDTAEKAAAKLKMEKERLEAEKEEYEQGQMHKTICRFIAEAQSAAEMREEEGASGFKSEAEMREWVQGEVNRRMTEEAMDENSVVRKIFGGKPREFNIQISNTS